MMEGAEKHNKAQKSIVKHSKAWKKEISKVKA